MRRQDAIDELIDRFVQKINRSPRARVREEDIPLHLREGGAQYGLYYSWTIQRFPYVNWIEGLEAKLPAPLPPSYRSLVTRYIFPAFEAPPLLLLANTGHTLYNEMASALFRDRVLCQILLPRGYVQFARPNTGDYDPVCFDTRRGGRDGECPIVRIDHEAALLDASVLKIEPVAPSFLGFVETFLEKDKGLLRV